MNLWIRSQDKMNLVKIRQISLDYSNTKQIIANYIPEIYENSGEYYELLGTYKTKERAIEVLDEIQNILRPKIVINFDNKPKYLEDGKINDVLIPREEIDYTKQLSTYVYEMPEK